MEQFISQSIDLKDTGSDTAFSSDVVFVKFKFNDSDLPIHKLSNISRA